MGLGILIALALCSSLSLHGVIHLIGLVRKAGAAATPPPSPAEIIGAAASRICDGSAAEGSNYHQRIFLYTYSVSQKNPPVRFSDIFTARCTLVQSAVLRSHVVCLSVCL